MRAPGWKYSFGFEYRRGRPGGGRRDLHRWQAEEHAAQQASEDDRARPRGQGGRRRRPRPGHRARHRASRRAHRRRDPPGPRPRQRRAGRDPLHRRGPRVSRDAGVRPRGGRPLGGRVRARHGPHQRHGAVLGAAEARLCGHVPQVLREAPRPLRLGVLRAAQLPAPRHARHDARRRRRHGGPEAPLPGPRGRERAGERGEAGKGVGGRRTENRIEMAGDARGSGAPGASRRSTAATAGSRISCAGGAASPPNTSTPVSGGSISSLSATGHCRERVSRRRWRSHACVSQIEPNLFG